MRECESTKYEYWQRLFWEPERREIEACSGTNVFKFNFLISSHKEWNISWTHCTVGVKKRWLSSRVRRHCMCSVVSLRLVLHFALSSVNLLHTGHRSVAGSSVSLEHTGTHCFAEHCWGLAGLLRSLSHYSLYWITFEYESRYILWCLVNRALHHPLDLVSCVYAVERGNHRSFFFDGDYVLALLSAKSILLEMTRKVWQRSVLSWWMIAVRRT